MKMLVAKSNLDKLKTFLPNLDFYLKFSSSAISDCRHRLMGRTMLRDLCQLWADLQDQDPHHYEKLVLIRIIILLS